MDAIADTFSLAFHTSPLLSGIALTAAVWYVLVTLRTMSSGKVAASAASGVERQEAMLRARELQQPLERQRRLGALEHLVERGGAPLHQHAQVVGLDAPSEEADDVVVPRARQDLHLGLRRSGVDGGRIAPKNCAEELRRRNCARRT